MIAPHRRCRDMIDKCMVWHHGSPNDKNGTPIHSNFFVIDKKSALKFRKWSENQLIYTSNHINGLLSRNTWNKNPRKTPYFPGDFSRGKTLDGFPAALHRLHRGEKPWDEDGLHQWRRGSADGERCFALICSAVSWCRFILVGWSCLSLSPFPPVLSIKLFVLWYCFIPSQL